MRTRPERDLRTTNRPGGDRSHSHKKLTTAVVNHGADGLKERCANCGGLALVRTMKWNICLECQNSRA